jgi:hypothetical protein
LEGRIKFDLDKALLTSEEEVAIVKIRSPCSLYTGLAGVVPGRNENG